MTINQFIESVLATITPKVPYAFLKYDGSDKTFLVYYSYETPELSVNDGLRSSVFHFSVVVYSDGNYLDILQQLRTKFAAAGAVWIEDSADMYDDDAKIYYKTADFAVRKGDLPNG